MKTTVMSFGRYFVIGAVLVAVGALLLLPAGRRRGSKAYGWRIALWAFAISMLSAGPVLGATRSADKPGSTGVDQVAPDDEVQPKCYKPIVTCYKPLPPDPPPPVDPTPDPDEDNGDDGDGGDDDGDDGATRPPEPQPTCYAPMPVPSCYEPIAPEPPGE